MQPFVLRCSFCQDIVAEGMGIFKKIPVIRILCNECESKYEITPSVNQKAIELDTKFKELIGGL